MGENKGYEIRAMEISTDRIKEFQDRVLSFYETQGRDHLPWRKTTDPYEILVSEVMLHQTQVNRVLDYYGKWITRWPTVHSLAEAGRAEVLASWMGLGYNNRAINFHRATGIIVSKHRGDVLAAIKDYRLLPGIGKYTARAVEVFAANADLVMVDTNIRRILIHEFALGEEAPEKEIWDMAARCLPTGRSRQWHNALMDYGALYLTSRKTAIRPRTSQSRFEGSDRQIRARLLRSLLTGPLDATRMEEYGEKERMCRILGKMEKEGLISAGHGCYRLTS